ncbi:MAG: porin [Gemmatimonadota bacterium]|nr:porin [Gemmatimonadota bacterium]
MDVLRSTWPVRTGLPALLAGLFLTAPLGAQDITTKALDMEVGGRVQMQAATSSCNDFPIPPESRCAMQVGTTDLLLRRVRVSVAGRLNDELDFKIEPDFAKVDDVRLKDAWGRYTFSPAARLKVGHFKRPFDGFELVSSSQILTIERDIRIEGLDDLAALSLGAATSEFELGDRDVGAELSGTAPGGFLSYRVGVFNGDSDADARDTNGAKQVVGRLQYERKLGRLPVRLAVAAASTDLEFRTAETGLESVSYEDFEVFSEIGDFDVGPHVMAGVVFGDNPRQAVSGAPIDLEGGEFATFVAWQAIGSWKLATTVLGLEAVEPLFRVTRGDPNTDVDDDASWGFTPGVQFFFQGRNKLSLNWDFATWEEDGIDSENAFRSQMQFYF